MRKNALGTLSQENRDDEYALNMLSDQQRACSPPMRSKWVAFFSSISLVARRSKPEEIRDDVGSLALVNIALPRGDADHLLRTSGAAANLQLSREEVAEAVAQFAHNGIHCVASLDDICMAVNAVRTIFKGWAEIQYLNRFITPGEEALHIYRCEPKLFDPATSTLERRQLYGTALSMRNEDSLNENAERDDGAQYDKLNPTPWELNTIAKLVNELNAGHLKFDQAIRGLRNAGCAALPRDQLKAILTRFFHREQGVLRRDWDALQTSIGCYHAKAPMEGADHAPSIGTWLFEEA